MPEILQTDTFIYYGSDVTVSGVSFKKGQYLYYDDYGTGYNSSNWWTYAAGIQKSFSMSGHPVESKFKEIRSFNEFMYGSVNNHPASGGCMYTIRRTARLMSSNGNYYGTTLNPGDVVIIGAFLPHGERGAIRGIRCWGFKRGGRSGADVETSGLYVESGELSAPSNYCLNTL